MSKIDDSLQVGDMVSFCRVKDTKYYYIVYSITPSQYNTSDKSINMKLVGDADWKRQALLHAEMMNNKVWNKE
jgi:hypothetical protein